MQWLHKVARDRCSWEDGSEDCAAFQGWAPPEQRKCIGGNVLGEMQPDSHLEAQGRM